jgi:hypothetical protein
MRVSECVGYVTAAEGKHVKHGQTPSVHEPYLLCRGRAAPGATRAPSTLVHKTG